ncbi:hypothetical protein [Bifidobacterium sp. ESL0732]|uniref:YobI family P-loop NTPase n=1 Tax=Bifidobacterium sp. ESL0732 TaxID=2983222 RepID=UPI0023F80386|nr:hypothetical protein [Bifidobacterium sp. ESL0732]WEV64686.1 hypothetical protein OZX70_03725 [Bifidobacterium sp. ESL0732]
MNSNNDENKLEPLYPKYSNAYHKRYVNHLEDALKDYKNHNIALSGPFGSGKSSILEKVYERHRSKTVKVSLALLASNASVQGNADSMNEASSSNAERTLSVNVNERFEEAEPLNNILQKEIVKQLLYSVDSTKLPRSRFHGIKSVPWLKLFAASLFSGVVGAVLFMAFGWYSNLKNVLLGIDFPVIDEIVNQINKLDPSKFAITSEEFLCSLLVVLCSIGIGILFYLNIGRLSLKGMRIGEAELNFDNSDSSDPYFERYLDEIVYFFKSTGKRIVIFEDLDRFSDSAIFDSLRELNLILNAGAMTKNWHGEFRNWYRPVQFVYAIKDNIFPDQIGHDSKGTVPFSRAKFFDVIISVVPFISHENAYRIAMNLFKKDLPELDEEVLAIACKHIPDERTLTNIHNEYISYSEEFCSAYKRIFHKKLLSNKTDGSRIDASGKHFKEITFGDNETGLSYSKLLGFLIYKNVYVTDAVKLQNRNSGLDKLYNDYCEIRDSNMKLLSQKVNDLQKRYSAIGDKSDSQYAQQLHDELCDVIQKCFNRPILQLLIRWSIGEHSEAFDDKTISVPDFWKKFLDLGNDTKIQIDTVDQYGRQNFLLFLTKIQLNGLLHKNLKIFTWEKDKQNKLLDQIESLVKQQEILAVADFDYFMAHDTWKTKTGCSLDECVSKYFKINSRLISDLIKNGYLAQDYALYFTVPDSGITPEARDFMYHVIDLNQVGGNKTFRFGLGEEGAKDAVKSMELRKIDFADPMTYDIDILDYLFDKQNKKNIASLPDKEDYNE